MVVFLYDKIKIINSVLEEYFDDDIYNLFLNKYCYDYHLILKHYFKDAVLVVEKNNYHCSTLINNNVYDVTGLRCKNDFVLANKNDLDFILDFYNKLDNNIINVLESSNIRQYIYKK